MAEEDQAQQLAEWQAAREAAGEDPKDPEAFSRHLAAIGAVAPSGGGADDTGADDTGADDTGAGGPEPAPAGRTRMDKLKEAAGWVESQDRYEDLQAFDLEGGENWAKAFARQHDGYGPTWEDYYDRLWSLDFARNTGRAPIMDDWKIHYYSKYRGTDPETSVRIVDREPGRWAPVNPAKPLTVYLDKHGPHEFPDTDVQPPEAPKAAAAAGGGGGGAPRPGTTITPARVKEINVEADIARAALADMGQGLNSTPRTPNMPIARPEAADAAFFNYLIGNQGGPTIPPYNPIASPPPSSITPDLKFSHPGLQAMAPPGGMPWEKGLANEFWPDQPPPVARAPVNPAALWPDAVPLLTSTFSRWLGGR